MVGEATTVVGKRVRGAKGAYAEMPKASTTFEAQNAPNRDVEGVKRLDLHICDDSVVKYHSYGCRTLMSRHKMFVVAKIVPFPAPLTPTEYSTNMYM